MRDLLTDPACRAEDLGLPLPVDPHAVSVALPLWKHVIGYEENSPEVIDVMQCGYPRFFLHPLVRKLARQVAEELATGNETAWLFASKLAADRAQAFLGEESRRASWRDEIEVVFTPEGLFERGKLAWRFFGEGISSRRAEAVLHGSLQRIDHSPAKEWIRNDLAARSGQQPEDVFLFPSGIAAMAAAHRIARLLRPGNPSVQVDFPYVDVLKVQETHPDGVTLLNASGSDSPPLTLNSLDPEHLSAVFTEIASNPQLRTPDLATIARQLAPHGIPLVADDTIATIANVDVYPFTDVVTTSLTKYYSGTGNVLAGSLILKRNSPHYHSLRSALEKDYPDDLFEDDAMALAENARDFDQRILQINRSAEIVAEYLDQCPEVEEVWYPKLQTREYYDRIRRAEGGYGGLLSFHLRRPAKTTPDFYDRLQISKGPSLGSNFSLACPYMLLAHYPELDWTDSVGLDRHLIRLSVGLEPVEVLIRRLEEALQGCQG